MMFSMQSCEQHPVPTDVLGFNFIILVLQKPDTKYVSFVKKKNYLGIFFSLENAGGHTFRGIIFLYFRSFHALQLLPYSLIDHPSFSNIGNCANSGFV